MTETIIKKEIKEDITITIIIIIRGIIEATVKLIINIETIKEV